MKKKSIIKIILNIIGFVYVRKYIKAFVRDCFYYLKILLNDKFKDYNIEKPTVLIVEPNSYHGECLCGFVKYFQDLNYNVVLLLRFENNVEDIFCRFSNLPKVFYGTKGYLKKILKSKKVKQYDFVFIQTTAFFDGNIHTSYLNYLTFEPKGKNGLLLVEHTINPFIEEFKEQKYLQQNHLFTLTGFQNTLMVNPHYFGDKVNIIEKSTDTTNFIAIGGINKSHKDHSLIFKSAEYLLQKGLNFKITVIGGGKLNIPEQFKNNICFKGKLNFKQMFLELEKADFILTLMNLDIVEHHKYLTNTTSGSYQLSLGFLKPLIINETFAKVYNLDDNNSITYTENNMEIAMQIGCYMSRQRYKEIQDNLSVLEKKIYFKSLENLKIGVGK